MALTFTDYKDGIVFQGANGSTYPPAFSLLGGKYVLTAGGTWNSGSLTLQVLMPDGTYQAVGSSTTLSANGLVMIDLPPGTYQLVTATVTAVQGSLVKCPMLGHP